MSKPVRLSSKPSPPKHGRQVIPRSPQDWDSRFVLGRLHQYSTPQQIYSPKSVGMKNRPRQLQRVKGFPGKGGKNACSKNPSIKQRPSQCFSARGQQRAENAKAESDSLVSQKTVNVLRKEVVYLWSANGVPSEYQKAYFESISHLPMAPYIQTLAVEIDKLYNKSSPVQGLGKVIKRREVHIEKLRSTQEVDEAKAREDLNRLRDLTLAVGESAASMRKQLANNCGSSKDQRTKKIKRLPIMYEGNNYLIKMMSDTEFLSESEYGKIFAIRRLNDPFLLAAANPQAVTKSTSKRTQITVLKQKEPAAELPVSSQLLKRIKAVERVLLKEQIQNSQKQEERKDTASQVQSMDNAEPSPNELDGKESKELEAENKLEQPSKKVEEKKLDKEAEEKEPPIEERADNSHDVEDAEESKKELKKEESKGIEEEIEESKEDKHVTNEDAKNKEDESVKAKTDEDVEEKVDESVKAEAKENEEISEIGKKSSKHASSEKDLSHSEDNSDQESKAAKPKKKIRHFGETPVRLADIENAESEHEGPKEDSIGKLIEEEAIQQNAEEPAISDSPQFHPLKLNESDIPDLISWYRSKLSTQFLNAYSPLSKLAERAELGCNPVWLHYGNTVIPSGEFEEAVRNDSLGCYVKGLAVFNIDPTSRAQPRILILHASFIDEEIEMSKYFQELIDYIWQSVSCNEIRVELSYSFQESDKPTPYEDLKNELQRQQFKWRTLVNDREGNRSLVLSLTRPKGSVFNNPKGMDYTKEPITFKNAVSIALSKKPVSEIKGEFGEAPQSLCGCLEAIRLLREDGEMELKVGGELGEIMRKGASVVRVGLMR